IRVFHVTGVQTCALPILAGSDAVAAGAAPATPSAAGPAASACGAVAAAAAASRSPSACRQPTATSSVAAIANASLVRLPMVDPPSCPVAATIGPAGAGRLDRKSTRLNSSHVKI